MDRDYFTKKIGGMSFTENANGYTISLDFKPLGEKLDRAQDALDAQVWQDVQKYMPVDSGLLKSETNVLNQTARGEVYLYPPNSDYGHYQYEGIVYVDPVYGKGAFFSPTYGFWSRPSVQKVPSDRKLTYSQPNATARWGETAINNHGAEWLKLVERALK